VIQYDFQWDLQKASVNVRKHGITFEQASTVFRDPKAISVYDTYHSKAEERWLTSGICSTGALLVVHHTFTQIDDKTAVIRIISSRKATQHEARQYTE
jgi:hypothetical protein